MNYQVKSKQTWKAVSFCSITANGSGIADGGTTKKLTSKHK